MSATILIADDKIKWVKMLAELLNSAGYQVLTTDNGHDALALALAHFPDLLVLDYAMPSFTGKEVAYCLRRENRFQNTPIIFVSAHEEPFEHLDDADLAPSIFMPKPVNPDEVVSKIRGLLALHRN